MSACAACGSPFPAATVGPRAACERCAAWLHSCRNCRFYDPAAHGNCREPAADFVADPEGNNFCDFFSPADLKNQRAGDAGARARKELDELFRKGS